MIISLRFYIANATSRHRAESMPILIALDLIVTIIMNFIYIVLININLLTSYTCVCVLVSFVFILSRPTHVVNAVSMYNIRARRCQRRL